MSAISRCACLLAIGLSFGLGGQAAASPVSVTLTGYIDYINGDTTSAIGADVVGIVSVSDSASLSVQYDLGGILGISATLNSGALTMSYNPAAGPSFFTNWGSFLSIIDYDQNGAGGAITGTIIPTSDPSYTTDWHARFFVLYFTGIFPSTPNFTYANLFWGASLPGSFQQSYISVTITDAQFNSQVPLPADSPGAC